MAFEVGILFALISMFSWGIADFFAKKAIDKIGYLKSLFINQLIALGPLFIYAAFFYKFPAISAELILLTLAVSIIGIIGYAFFYKGLGKGNISIVSPITASWALVTALLGIIFFGEKLSSLQTFGVGAIFVGVFLTSTHLKELKESIMKGRYNGVLEALIAMFSWGITFALIKLLVDLAGPVMAALFARMFGLLILFSWIRISNTKIQIPPKGILLFLIIAGGLDVFGFVTYNIGITTEFISIVSPIAAIFPAVTIILAYIFLKERLVGNQIVGVLSILVGLVLISLI